MYSDVYLLLMVTKNRGLSKEYDEACTHQPRCRDDVLLKNGKSGDILAYNSERFLLFYIFHLVPSPLPSIYQPQALHYSNLLIINSQNACLHRDRHLPSRGPLRRSALHRQIIQILQHHRQHILHLLRRRHPHRRRLRPDPLKLQHVLERQPYRRRLCGSIRQCSNTDALTQSSCL